MKKIICFLLAISLAFTFVACGKSKDNVSSESDTVSGSQTTEFVKPANYAAVLEMTINPQFRIYLDTNNIALALEYVNEDAKSLNNEISFSADLSSLINSIITTANQNNFIKAEATIDFKITEVRDSSADTDEILSNAVNYANKTVRELKITVKINSSTDIPSKETAKDESANTNIDDTSSTSNSSFKPTGTSSTQSSSKKDTSTTTNNHTHSFSNATCTEPEKCACGATKGNALGHNWQAATCVAPKTCKVCKATEGSASAHSFKNDKCTICGKSNFLDPKSVLASEIEYVANYRFESGELIASGISFFNNDSDGIGCLLLTPYFVTEKSYPEQLPITFENKTYYHEGAGMTPYHLEFTENEIIVKNSFYEETPNTITMKLVVLSDGKLKVTSSSDERYHVGTVLTATKWSQ